jgi:hypothetical protein
MSKERLISEFNLPRLSAKLVMVAMLAAGFTAAVGAPQVWAQTSPASVRSDSEIQSDVAYALSNSQALKGQQITAATVEGAVTISGNVRDMASKELAESLVYRIQGVQTVTNNLTVGDAQAQPQASDGNAQAAANEQDPNYDPAQQNLAPAGANDQAQDGGQPMPPPQDGAQYPAQDPSQGAGQAYPNNTQPGYAQPGYAQNQQQPLPPQQPAVPVTIPAGTLLQVRTSEPLDANHSQPGQVFQATVAADVYQGSVLALPRGAVVTGKVISTTTNKGDLAGKQGLSLALTNVNLGGQVFPLPTDTWAGQGPGKGGYTATNTVGGAAFGALIGAIAGRGPGAAIGAVAGGAVGAGASAATSGPRMYLPAEAVVNFHLTAPVTVTPVSQQEAQRLASSSEPRQPQLRPRGAYPYAGYPPPPPYYYGYRYPVAYPYYYGYRY